MNKLRLFPFSVLLVFCIASALPATVATQDRARTIGNQQSALLMPNLIGKDVDAAERELKNIFRQIRIAKRELQNPNCSPGKVMEQAPRVNTPLNSETLAVLYHCKKEPRTGEVVIGVIGGILNEALKERETEVPEVVGLTVQEAKQKLKDRKLKAKFRSKGDDASELRIATQSEPPGKKVRVNSSVSLTVEQPRTSWVTETQPRRQRDRPPKEWLVPDVTGKTLEEATQIIAEADLAVGIKETRVEPNGSNLIASQNPVPNSRLTQKIPVNLVIAVRPEQVIVPRLIDLSLNEAEKKLAGAGLTKGYVVGVSANLPQAIVVNQSRPPGTSVDRGSSIGVTLGLPPTPSPIPPTPIPATPTTVIVPNLSGMTLEEARERLRAVRLGLGQPTTQQSNSPQGTVIEQYPGANAQAALGSFVNVVLATPIPGVASPLPSPPLVTVPDLGGLTREAASQNLLAVNLRLGLVTEAQSNSRPGTVLSQTPEPGTSVPPGSVVRIVLAVPTPTSVVDPKPPAPPEDWLSKLIKDAPKALVAIGLGFFGLLLASLLKKLVRPKDEKDELLSLTAPISEPSPSPALVKPNIEYRAQADTGTQSLETETRLSLPFEFTLRPLSDVGKQWVEVVGQLIANERSEA